MGDPKPGQKRRAAIVATVVYAVPMTLALGFMTDRWDVAVGLSLASGVIFAAIMMRSVGRLEGRGGDAHLADAAPFDDDEPIVLEGPANHFKRIEGVGGKLFLTDTRLRFVSHTLNVQTHDESWPLDTIAEVEAMRTLKIIPNGLLVTLKDGTTERFVVWQHQQWADAIDARRS